MNTIIDRLESAKAKLDAVLAAKAAAIPAEVRQMLADIDAEFAPHIADAATHYAAAEEAAITFILNHNRTIK